LPELLNYYHCAPNDITATCRKCSCCLIQMPYVLYKSQVEIELNCSLPRVPCTQWHTVKGQEGDLEVVRLSACSFHEELA